MSVFTAQLLRRSLQSRKAAKWHSTFGIVADRLVAAFGRPTLGNFDDPVEEIFYIMLSARTTDAQYRKSHSALRRRFPSLSAMAAAPLPEIVACIGPGGLANKRAAHARNLATALLRTGDDPAQTLHGMAPQAVYEYIVQLPGMGPKSALCVMMYSLGHDVFPVDSNVRRVAARLGAIPAGLKHYQAQQLLPPLVPTGRSRELHVGPPVDRLDMDAARGRGVPGS
jgi:endonuclease-3